ncbi:hypothetical protein ACSFBF_06940 [Variovorax sp. ZT5P49]|uniref:hypothetical protein n=1 Tax=Variovorax sp. ZT5P49 TaxID=3443733 RepID=UPI003F48F0AB
MTDTAEATTTEIARSELHTYPDGSAVVGTPPWPEKSPKQIAAEAAERVGVPAEEPAPAPVPQTSNVVTADQVESSPEPQPVEPTPAELETIAEQIEPAAAPAPIAAPAPTSSRKR